MVHEPGPLRHGRIIYDLYDLHLSIPIYYFGYFLPAHSPKEGPLDFKCERRTICTLSISEQRREEFRRDLFYS